MRKYLDGMNAKVICNDDTQEIKREKEIDCNRDCPNMDKSPLQQKALFLPPHTVQI